MLVVISPAKALDMDPVEDRPFTDPAFPDQTAELTQIARHLSVDDLTKLMKISDKLAVLNHDRFQAMGSTPVKQAAFTFAGDTYQGLDFKTLDRDDQDWAQDHLRILSGLYGLLRPYDGIEAYRLEMGSRLANPRGKSLYDFWGDQIAQALNDHGSDLIVNCASTEYFRAADRKVLTPQVITPKFLENKDGTPKMVSFYAKQARGAMARFIIETRATTADDLHGFTTGGYVYDAEASTPLAPVFVRPYPA